MRDFQLAPNFGISEIALIEAGLSIHCQQEERDRVKCAAVQTHKARRSARVDSRHFEMDFTTVGVMAFCQNSKGCLSSARP